MHKPSYLHQYLSASTALLAIVTSGMHYAWPSPSLPQLTSNSSSFQITSDEGSWIVIMELIAPIPSCFIGAFIVDIIGRKRAILITAVPYFTAWMMIAFANSAHMLAIARFLAGLSDGFVFTAIPVYMAEIADPKIRGLLGTSISVSWIFGMLLVNMIGSYLSISLAAAVSSVVPFLLLVTFIWMPESPYFLIMSSDFDKAREALRKLTGKSDVEGELIRLQEAVQNRVERGRVLDLFKSKSNRRSLGIIAILRNAQQLSGVAAISFYTLSIFNEAGDFIAPLSATVIYVTIQCVMTGICSVIIDKAGRRPLLITSLIGSSVALFCEGTYFYLKAFTKTDTSSFNFVPVVSLIGYDIVFNLGAQPIPMLMQPELFPTNVRVIASCLSEAYFCVMASIVAKFFQMTRDAFGIYLPFYAFSLCCVLNLMVVVVFVPETKGKSLEEIQQGSHEEMKTRQVTS